MSTYNLKKRLSIPNESSLGGDSSISTATLSILMRKVYIWMSLALAVTGITALYVSSEYAIVSTIFENEVLFWGLLIAQLGLVFVFMAGLKKMSFSITSLLFFAYTLLIGITISFLFLVYTSESIASIYLITAGIFGIMSLYGYYTKKDLTTVGHYLFMGLIGLIIASLVNLFIGSSIFMWITTYLGVLIYVGLTACNTQEIKAMLLECANYEVNEDSMKLALFGSVMLYLDFTAPKPLRLLRDRK